jgi:glycosyltransferase involved in cell wall biosynthesis
MMSTGLPVVVTDIPELTDMVRDGVDGLVVPVGDADALACALDRLANDPALRTRLGAAARDTVMSGAGEPGARAVARFYDEVLRTETERRG